MRKGSNYQLTGILFIVGCIIMATIIYFAFGRSQSAPVANEVPVETELNISSGMEPNPKAEMAEARADTPQPSEGGNDSSQPSDDADAQAVPTGSTMFPEYRFADYPATIFAGPQQLPSFTGAQREFAVFRTRINEAARGAVGFAGNLAVATIGCGSGGCVRYYFIDKRTGKILEHEPANGGEDEVQYDDLTTRPDSLLALESFQASDDNAGATCVYNAYRWNGTQMVILTTKSMKVPESGDCPVAAN